MNVAISVSRFWLVLLGALCLPSTSTAQRKPDETESGPATGTITGHVISDNGQPLPGATIYLRGSIPFFQPRVAVTDSQGNFQVAGLDRALYGISGTAPGYVLPPRDPDTPPTYYRIGDSVTLNMVKGGVITGTVLSPSGEPMVQVAVQAVLIRDINGQRPKYVAYQSQRLTDDRGVYRIYGLLPGTYVVSAGGRGSFNVLANAYGTDAPTYSPSSTRDTASEISVRSGEERTGIDIRYRGEPGHVVSGYVSGVTDPTAPVPVNVNLTQILNGIPQAVAYSFQAPNGKGFSFYGVGDGEYDLTAQSFVVPGEMKVSDTRTITVKGADITGLELTVNPLAAINGRITLQPSDAIECKNKRQPLFSETLVMARRNEKATSKDRVRPFSVPLAQGAPNKSGDFTLRNLTPGEYGLNVKYVAKYWYLGSITRNLTSSQSLVGKPGPLGSAGQVPKQSEPLRNWITLKFGERAAGIAITIAGGAASLHGVTNSAPGENIPPRLYVYLVPAEKENSEDVFRFFVAQVNSDGTFALNNLAPGRYWALARVAADDDASSDSNLREPNALPLRSLIRSQAESGHAQVELKPCQNVVDFKLPRTPSAAPRTLK